MENYSYINFVLLLIIFINIPLISASSSGITSDTSLISKTGVIIGGATLFDRIITIYNNTFYNNTIINNTNSYDGNISEMITRQSADNHTIIDTYVPYVGATDDVNLSKHNLTLSGINIINEEFSIWPPVFINNIIDGWTNVALKINGNLGVQSSGNNTEIRIAGGEVNKNASLTFYDSSLDQWSIMFSGLSNDLFIRNLNYNKDLMQFTAAWNEVKVLVNLTVNENLHVIGDINDSKNLYVGKNANITGNVFITGNLSVKRPYFNGFDNSTQSFLNILNVQVMNITNYNNYDKWLINIANNNNITFEQTGNYMITISPEFYQSSGINKIITFWIRKNGVDVPWSNSRYTISNGQYYASSIVYQVSIENTVTDNVQIMWYSDSTATQIISISGLTLPTRPSIPGVLLNIQKISEIT